MIKENKILDRFKEDSINRIFYGREDKYGWAFESHYSIVNPENVQDNLLFNLGMHFENFTNLVLAIVNPNNKSGE